MASCDGHVQPGERLVHQQELGLLGQRTGDEHPLLLPARKLADLPACQRAHSHLGEALGHQPMIVSPGLPKEADPRDAPHQHHVSHRHGEVPIHLRPLRHVPDADVPTRDGAVHIHAAGRGCQDSGDGFQQRALARAVWADDRHPLAPCEQE